MKGICINRTGNGFRWLVVLALGGCILASNQARAANGCQLVKLAAMRLDDLGYGLVTTGEINGHPIKVFIDTGSVKTMIVDTAAEKAGLHPIQYPGTRIVEAGGDVPLEVVSIKRLSFGNLVIKNKTLPTAPWRVGESNVGLVLGQDVLSGMDVEMDVAHHSMIFWRPRNCRHTVLAYWGGNYMTARLKQRGGAPESSSKFGVDVRVDGRKIEAILNTGVRSSKIDLATARFMGFNVNKARVDYRYQTDGGRPISAYLATFKNIDIGSMRIKHARIVVSDMTLAYPNQLVGTGVRMSYNRLSRMVIGADFVHANRIYFANSQHMMYFTYNGGEIFRHGH